MGRQGSGTERRKAEAEQAAAERLVQLRAEEAAATNPLAGLDDDEPHGKPADTAPGHDLGL